MLYEDDDENDSGQEDDEGGYNLSLGLDPEQIADESGGDGDKTRSPRSEHRVSYNDLVFNETDIRKRRFPEKTAALVTQSAAFAAYGVGQLSDSDVARMSGNPTNQVLVELEGVPNMVYDYGMSLDRAYLTSLVTYPELSQETAGAFDQVADFHFRRIAPKTLEGKPQRKVAVFGPARENNELWTPFTGEAGLIPARRKQRLFVLSGVKTENGARKKTGSYWMRKNRVRFVWRRLLRKEGFGNRLGARLEDLSSEEAFIYNELYHQARFQVSKEFYTHEKHWRAWQRSENPRWERRIRLVQRRLLRRSGWGPKLRLSEDEYTPEDRVEFDATYAQARRIVMRDKGREDPRWEMIPFNTFERMEHFEAVKKMHDTLSKSRTAREDRLYPNTQSDDESLAAALELYKLGSTVVQKPNIVVEYEVNEQGNIKVHRVSVTHGITVVMSTDEWNHWRKTIDNRKFWLGLLGAYALAAMEKKDGRNARDKWIFCSIPETKLSDHVYIGMDARITLGPLVEKGDNFEIPDGPRLGGFYVQAMGEFSEGWAWLKEVVTRLAKKKEVLLKKELVEKTRLLQSDPEEIFWAYKGKDADGNDRLFFSPGPGRMPTAVPKYLWALYVNYYWVLLRFSFVQQTLVSHFNDFCADHGFDTRVSADGPESNIFRQRDVGYDLWRQQPLENIRHIFIKEHLEHMVEIGEWDKIRPEAVEFFTQLPDIHDGRPDVTDFFEDLLAFADRATLAHIVWLSADEHARNAKSGDVAKLLHDGWGIYPTERLAWRNPGPQGLWGFPGDPESQYNIYTFKGQQRRRWDLNFIPYDANAIVDSIRGLADQIQLGFQPTYDDVYAMIIKNLGSRGIYPKRVLTVLDMIESVQIKDKLVAEGKGLGLEVPTELWGGKTASLFEGWASVQAIKVMRATIEQIMANWEESVCYMVDNWGGELLRAKIGEMKGEGGMVDLVQDKKLIETVRGMMPGAKAA